MNRWGNVEAVLTSPVERVGGVGLDVGDPINAPESDCRSLEEAKSKASGADTHHPVSIAGRRCGKVDGEGIDETESRDEGEAEDVVQLHDGVRLLSRVLDAA